MIEVAVWDDDADDLNRAEEILHDIFVKQKKPKDARRKGLALL